MQAIETLKKTIKDKQGDVSEKEFDKIMKTGSKEGLDPQKGGKTKQREGTKIDQAKKSIPRVKKGMPGRVGSGRFNASFEAHKAKLRGEGDGDKSKSNLKAKKVGGGFKGRK